jgi:Cys-tRNA(Pro)/Cys-tRNA(Cys) deacylase
MDKTHAMRVLDAKKIPYTTKVYDDSGDFHSGAEAAALIGADASTVYKTLVVVRDDGSRGKPMLVMIPVEAELDLKRLAASVGAKKLRMAKQREAEDLTGMQAGGISALGLKQPSRFDVLLDASARDLQEFHISAGARGVDLELAVADLIGASGCTLVDIT